MSMGKTSSVRASDNSGQAVEFSLPTGEIPYFISSSGTARGLYKSRMHVRKCHVIFLRRRRFYGARKASRLGETSAKTHPPIQYPPIYPQCCAAQCVAIGWLPGCASF